MALIKCPECEQEISDKAGKCPHCGAPVVNKNAHAGCLVFVILFIGIVGWLIFGASRKDATTTSSEAAHPTCLSDWHLCKDNADFVEHYGGGEGSISPGLEWNVIGSFCKVAANAQARYGSPTWPWFPFSNYRQGNDYIKTGVAVSFEPDAQFQNGFGAMVHSTVLCTYDLNQKKVLNISITPK